MATVDTYTATPCGPNPGTTYEILKSVAISIPLSHLAAVRIADDSDVWICCTINRSQTNKTDETLVSSAVDSNYGVSECQACNEHW